MFACLCVSFKRADFPGDISDSDDQCVFVSSNTRIIAHNICFPMNESIDLSESDFVIRCWCGCEDENNLLAMKIISQNIIIKESMDLICELGTEIDGMFECTQSMGSGDHVHVFPLDEIISILFENNETSRSMININDIVIN